MSAAVLRWAALGLTALLASATAQASSSSAVLEQFMFQLVDLDPNDGVAPSFSFLANSSNNVAFARTVYSLRGAPDEDVRVDNEVVSTGIFAINSATQSGPGASATAVSTLESFASEGSATQYGMYAAISIAIGVYDSDFPFNILIGANTELIVSAHARLETHLDVCPPGPLMICESAYAEAILYTAYPVPGEVDYASGDGAYLTAAAGTAGTQTLSRVLSISLVNDSAQDVRQFLRADTGTTGAGINEVPEPGTSALMVTGLVALLAIGRLSRKRRAGVRGR